VAGGREIWGLPRNWLSLRGRRIERVTVRQGNRLLCSFNYNRQGLATVVRRVWFQYLGSDLLYSQLNLSLNLVWFHLEVPAESPFASLAFRSALVNRSHQMRLVVRQKWQRATTFSYRKYLKQIMQAYKLKGKLVPLRILEILKT